MSLIQDLVERFPERHLRPVDGHALVHIVISEQGIAGLLLDRPQGLRQCHVTVQTHKTGFHGSPRLLRLQSFANARESLADFGRRHRVRRREQLQDIRSKLHQCRFGRLASIRTIVIQLSDQAGYLARHGAGRNRGFLPNQETADDPHGPPHNRPPPSSQPMATHPRLRGTSPIVRRNRLACQRSPQAPRPSARSVTAAGFCPAVQMFGLCGLGDRVNTG